MVTGSWQYTDAQSQVLQELSAWQAHNMILYAHSPLQYECHVACDLYNQFKCDELLCLLFMAVFACSWEGHELAGAMSCW